MRPTIIDQQSDRSHAFLYKAAASMKSPEIFTDLISRVDTAALSKEASSRFADEYNRRFPLDSQDNTVLSALYFNHQKDLYPSGLREKVASRLDTYLNLHNIPDSLFEPAEVEKTAEEGPDPVYLLPSHRMCKVASAEDMQAAANLFEREHRNLELYDRVEFSRNFLKTAGDFGVAEFPPAVAKYASVLDSDLNNTRHLLEARAAAATRAGVDGGGYTKLASAVGGIDGTPTAEELEKMAWVIHRMDEEAGFDQPEYDRRQPDAFGVVFNKTADTAEMKTSDPADSRETGTWARADVIGRFGEGALEAVEDEDGNLDQDRIQELVRMYGREAEDGR